MILDETKLASTVLDGDGEETPSDAPTETDETTASATLLDGDGDDSSSSEEKKDDDGDSSPEVAN